MKADHRKARSGETYRFILRYGRERAEKELGGSVACSGR